jgi:DNA-binding transcriptional ArsR family regulator
VSARRVLERAIQVNNTSKQPAELKSLLGRAATNPLIARAVSHPMRMAVLQHLLCKQGEATDEGELAESVGLSLPSMRYHLTVLRDSDLITCIETDTERLVAATWGQAWKLLKQRAKIDAIAADSREFLIQLFTDLCKDLADQADAGGPSGPDPETVARNIAVFDALLGVLLDESEMPDDDRVRSYVEELAKATDKENEYEHAVREHRAFAELRNTLNRQD